MVVVQAQVWVQAQAWVWVQRVQQGQGQQGRLERVVVVPLVVLGAAFHRVACPHTSFPLQSTSWCMGGVAHGRRPWNCSLLVTMPKRAMGTVTATTPASVRGQEQALVAAAVADSEVQAV